MKNKGMIRRALLLGAATLMLAGCGKDLLGPPEAGPIYAVRPVFPHAPDAEKVPWSLSIMRPNVPGGLDSDRIALLQPGGVIDYYAKATYPDQVSPMVQQALLDGFEATNRITAVSREQDALQSDYMLVVEVKSFEARYAVADGIPDVAVTLIAKLTTSRGRKIVGSVTVAKTGTATANSAQAATQALQVALGAAVSDIVAWTLSAPVPVTASSLPSREKLPQTNGSPGRQLLRDVTRGSESLPQQ